MRVPSIITTSREVYEKLNMLQYTDEVVIKKVSCQKINNLIDKCNSKCFSVVKEDKGDSYLLKKVNPFKANIYFRN